MSVKTKFLILLVVLATALVSGASGSGAALTEDTSVGRIKSPPCTYEFCGVRVDGFSGIAHLLYVENAAASGK